MKNRFFIIACIVSFLFSFQAQAQDDLINKIKGNQSEHSKFVFSKVIDLENTSIKDQGSSGTCWSYSTVSFLESEMARIGRKPVDLAEMFIVRNQYIEKAENYVRMHGGLLYGQGGAAHDVTKLYGKYGILPQSAYTGLHYGTTRNNFNELESVLKGFLTPLVGDNVKSLTPVWKTAFTKVVDTYLGDVPEKFTYEGKEYTPKTFAEKVVGLNADDYVEFSSFTTSPFYQQAVLMVPDNWSYDRIYNVPMNDLSTIVDYALKNGFSLTWGTDVSERGFSWKNGVAYVLPMDYADMSEDQKKNIFNGPQPEGSITQEERQVQFDNYQTTDDHGMQIVGLYTDQNGKEYYKVKNSWGEKNDFNGYIYVTKNFLKFKTTALLLHKDGVPKDIRQKCKI
ncbi:MAG: aminopeptidase [Saprospiraceae bacterium]|jgi:bleomycin hydrolase|nr:aminopeptidase [Saprospiraceae bacterium]MCO5277770.1 C1 family peptidase [Saprospiraceae bacterium]HMT77455.1 C1 family peptidase [Saprospiraceae bacterium]HQU96352.1 C1 family peptidase [Saprospiraceae bacterium]HQW94824.1 C1 family peptidase [Saprospiraceae bacterium]